MDAGRGHNCRFCRFVSFVARFRQSVSRSVGQSATSEGFFCCSLRVWRTRTDFFSLLLSCLIPTAEPPPNPQKEDVFDHTAVSALCGKRPPSILSRSFRMAKKSHEHLVGPTMVIHCLMVDWFLVCVCVCVCASTGSPPSFRRTPSFDDAISLSLSLLSLISSSA